MNPRGRFVRSDRGDGITWVGPKAGETPSAPSARSAAPAKRGWAKPLVALAGILVLQGVILLAFRAKEDERASQQTVAETMAASEAPLQDAPPAWSAPLSAVAFPGLEAIRRAGQAHVVRKPGARQTACRGACE